MPGEACMITSNSKADYERAQLANISLVGGVWRGGVQYKENNSLKAAVMVFQMVLAD